MRLVLDRPYADVRAADLSLAVGLPPQDALARLAVPLPDGTTLEVRLLGASHQILLDVDGRAWSETVSCGAAPEPGLPRTALDLGPARYEFTARVDVLPPRRFARRVGLIAARVAAERHGLVGEFPGAAYAVTALSAQPRPDGVTWRTWHSYPGEWSIVRTRSRLRAATALEAAA